MIASAPKTHIAYRCPECGTVVYAFIGKFALAANMIRTKCPCGHSAIDVTVTNDGKIRLSVPCVFCKQNHSYVVSQSIFFGRELFLLNCPYSNMDICFIGEKENTDREVERTGAELQKLLADLSAESLSDIQPTEPEEDEAEIDPAAYDTVRFIFKELEAEGRVDCPCHSGNYDLRFCDCGIEVFCEDCGASYLFCVSTAASSEDYISLDSITLT